MAASDPVRARRVAVCVALIGAVAVADCGGGEYVHSNPFDPVVPVTLRIEGPDKTVAQFDTVRFKVVTDPVYDYGSAVWSATGGLEKLDENGTFRAPRTGQFSGPVQVTATLGPRKAQATVMVTYQPASFRMRNCTDGSRTIQISALDSTAQPCVTVYDARGGIISVYGIPISLVATSLDTSVAAVPNPGQVRSVGNGTTKVVYSFNGISDTLAVVVRQQVTSLTISPSSCSDRTLLIPVGTTVQLTLGAPAFDATGHPVTDPTEIQNAIASAGWYMGSDSPFYITLTQGGLVTGAFQSIIPGNPYGSVFATVGYFWRRNSGGDTFGGSICYIGVTP
jgi:hypothetical protein